MNQFIVCVGSTDWEGINHRPQHMLRGLAAAGWRILYVNAPVTWLSPIKNRSLLRKWDTQWRSAEAEPGVRVLNPPVVAPFGSMWPASNIWNQNRLARAINAELEREGAASYVLYTLLPSAVDLLPLLSGDCRVLYDCVDDHAAFTGLISKDYVTDLERRITKESDIVFATSEKLAERLRGFAGHPYLMPNGVHVDHFSVTPDKRERGQAFKKSLGADVIVGFVGGIADWIDTDMLAELAGLRPQYTLVLVGPVLTDVGRLAQLPNVRITGPKPYADLPWIVQSFDVGLSPFRLNELTESVNPVKVYEYLAAGLEVIAAPMRELLPMAEALHFARTGEELAVSVDGIVDGSLKTPPAVREKIARDNSWIKRIAETDRMLKELLQ
ncbi:MAG: glycosyltransferase family protein [Bacilli bacterium]